MTDEEVESHRMQLSAGIQQGAAAATNGSACDGCKYLGHEYTHLQGVHGVARWVSCNYPLPFYVVPSATPLVEGTCKTHAPKQ